MADAFLARLEGPSPAAQVGRDLVKRGVFIAPVLMVVGLLIWGNDGFWSVGYGVAIIVINFALSAFLIASTARISLSLMMAAVLFGFLIRLGIVFVAVWVVKDAAWMEFVALGITIIVTHLGLLFWELRYVSASLAYPGLKPGVGDQTKTPARMNTKEHSQP
jgi:hypothetical protein